MSSFVQLVQEMAKTIESMPTRQETLTKCIENKLKFSEDMYNYQVREAYNYLLSRDNLKVVKTIARENKKKGV